MTNEDRDLLQRLRAEEEDLRRALAQIGARLDQLEVRAGANGLPTVPPPIPSFSDRLPAGSLPPLPPSIIEHAASGALPPLPVTPFVPPILPAIPAAELPPIPAAAPPPPPAKPPIEFRLGPWLTRLGALFFVLTLISLDAVFHLHHYLGRAGQLGLMGGVSVVLVALGRRLERRHLRAYGRTLMAAGLGGLYFTCYAATAIPPWQLVTNPIVGGIVLLLWSAYVFDLARRGRSQPLALLALVLAYVSSSLNPVTRFTLAADLILAGTAVLFFLRFGWRILLSFSLAGTYLAIARRLLINENNELVFDTSRALAFAPHAVYLVAAWGAFTAAVLLGRAFRTKVVFLTVNNALGAGLLALAAIICGYGSDRTGAVLLLSGAALLAISVYAARRVPELAGAYLAQGLALATGGVMMVFLGATRSILLLTETLFLGMAGAITRSRVLTVSAAAIAFFTTTFLLWTISVEVRHPWLLGVAGAAVMLKCAWWTRQRIRAPHFAWPATLYSALGLTLLGALLTNQLDAAELPPTLALFALAATLIGFALRLGELPPVAQIMLLAAQGLALFPTENGEPVTGWSAGLVMIATLAMIFVVRRTWLRALDSLYALALVGLIYHAVRPEVTGQVWMIEASLLAIFFLAVGAISRIWSLAWMGQIFLAVAVWHFFQRVPTQPWAALVPLTAVFATGRAIHRWLHAFPGFTGMRRQAFRTLAFFYQLVALLMLVDALVALLPQPDLAPTFLLLGTLVLMLNARKSRAFGMRCSFVLSGLGALIILFAPGLSAVTFFSAFGMLLFLVQPSILARAPKPTGTVSEAWLLILVSSVTGWVFIAGHAAARFGGGAITASWAIYALLLFLVGLMLRERRQRWCGLCILLAAILRVFAVDFWALSGGFRVLTFIVLTFITLGMGYLYARHAGRFKTLL
jgi:hypothetical protein